MQCGARPSCAAPVTPSCCPRRVPATTCFKISGTAVACFARRSPRSARGGWTYEVRVTSGARDRRTRYRCGMQRASIAALPLIALACGPGHAAAPPKAPNTELIVGEYERHPPEGQTAIRFRGDG